MLVSVESRSNASGAFGSRRRPLPPLPIAQSPIGKVEPCAFGMRAQNGRGLGAPESLPPMSEIGDGR